MADQMGTFRVDVEIESPARPGEKRMLRSVLVDTGAELSWFPADLLQSLGVEPIKVWRFRQADGTVLARWTGAVKVSLAGVRTVDEVVFGQAGDLVLLGARSLEGLNLRVDPVSRQLVDAGPAPAAVARASALSFGSRQSAAAIERWKPQPLGCVTGRAYT
jgi:predicted aspartyl protease